MQKILLKLWIFFGFRIWGIGLVLVISYFGFTNVIPVFPEKEFGYFLIVCGVAWAISSLFKLFRAQDPSRDDN